MNFLKTCTKKWLSCTSYLHHFCMAELDAIRCDMYKAFWLSEKGVPRWIADSCDGSGAPGDQPLGLVIEVVSELLGRLIYQAKNHGNHGGERRQEHHPRDLRQLRWMELSRHVEWWLPVRQRLNQLLWQQKLWKIWRKTMVRARTFTSFFLDRRIGNQRVAMRSLAAGEIGRAVWSNTSRALIQRMVMSKVFEEEHHRGAGHKCDDW